MPGFCKTSSQRATLSITMHDHAAMSLPEMVDQSCFTAPQKKNTQALHNTNPLCWLSALLSSLLHQFFLSFSCASLWLLKFDAPALTKHLHAPLSLTISPQLSHTCRSHYSRNCFLRSPLGAAKTSLKQQVVCETRVAKTCPCKVNTFLLLKFEVKYISKQLQRTCSCIHCYFSLKPYFKDTCQCNKLAWATQCTINPFDVWYSTCRTTR